MKIRITSKSEGFRRGGIAHSRAAKEHDSADFTDEQLAQIMAEPMLVVDILGEEAKAKKEATDKPKPAAAPVKTPNPLAEKAKAIKAAATLADLDVLAKDETNAGMLKLIAKRRQELSTAQA